MIEGKRKGRGRPMKNDEKIVRIGPSSEHSTVIILSSFFYVNEMIGREGRKSGGFTIYDPCEKFSPIDYHFHSLEEELQHHYPRFVHHRSVLAMLKNMCGIGKKDVFRELLTMFHHFIEKVLAHHPDPISQFLHGNAVDSSFPYLRLALEKRLQYGFECEDAEDKLQELWQPYVRILLESFHAEWEGKQANKYYPWIVKDDEMGNNRKLRDIWVQCNKNNPTIEVHDRQVQTNTVKGHVSFCSGVIMWQIKPQYYHQQHTIKPKRQNPEKAIQQEWATMIKKKPMLGFQQDN